MTEDKDLCCKYCGGNVIRKTCDDEPYYECEDCKECDCEITITEYERIEEEKHEDECKGDCDECTLTSRQRMSGRLKCTYGW